MPETTELLAQKRELIFFTGSPQVGKIIHKAAVENFTPAVDRHAALLHHVAMSKVLAEIVTGLDHGVLNVTICQALLALPPDAHAWLEASSLMRELRRRTPVD